MLYYIETHDLQHLADSMHDGVIYCYADRYIDFVRGVEIQETVFGYEDGDVWVRCWCFIGESDSQIIYYQ